MSTQLRWLLGLSLLLNALLFGVVMGEMSYRFSLPEAAPASADPMAGLSDKTRALYQTTLQSAWADMNASRMKIAEGKKEALHLLTAPTFDAGAYLALVKHLDDLHNQMKQHLAQTIVTLAKQSTPEERAALAAIISRASPPPVVQPHCPARHK